MVTSGVYEKNPPSIQSSQTEQKTYRNLPPLYISKVANNLLSGNVNVNEEEPCLKIIEFIVNNACLISQKGYNYFKKLGHTTLASHRIISYSAKRNHKDPLLEALKPIEDDSGEKEDEDSKTSSKREFLFFLTGIPQAFTKSKPPPEVYVLSTRCAYKIIRDFCSPEFSRNICAHLSSQLIKIEQIITGQLLGPISESELSFRNLLPINIEQSGLVCREVTLILHPFSHCLPGNQVKVKFSDRGIVIYRELSIKDYIEIIDFFATKKLLDSNQREWGLSEVPEEFSLIQDTRLDNHMDQMLIYYLIDDPLNKLDKWTFDLDLSKRLYKRAFEFRLRYLYPKTVNAYSVIDTLTDPYYPLTFAELKNKLSAIYYEKSIINSMTDPTYSVEDIFRNKEVCIEYKEGDVWLSQDVLDCVEGCVKTPENKVFFRSGSRWYLSRGNYVQKIDESLLKVISNSFLLPKQPGYLFHPWSKGVGEEAYNRSYQSSGNLIWMEGNRKRKSLGIEVGDIFHICERNFFIYHVKKSFNYTIREAVTQLCMSAQQVRSNINNAMNTYNPLYQFCKAVAGDNLNLMINALTNGTCHFVLAFPLKFGNHPLDDQAFIQSKLISKSIIAKREVIRAKDEIEKLGFSFKMCIIKLE